MEVSAEGARLAGGPPHPGAPLDPAPLLAAVGLEGDDVAGPAALAGCGSDFAYLLVRPEAVARAVPDVAVLHALLGDLGLSVPAWDGHAARSRVFHPSAGVAEDPATGSAAVRLGVHLAAAGLLPDGTTAYDVHQGAELGRPSLMHCTVPVEDGRAVATTVGGSVVPVASGLCRKSFGLEGGTGEVEGASAVQCGGGSCEAAGRQDLVFVGVAAGQVQPEAPHLG